MTWNFSRLFDVHAARIDLLLRVIARMWHPDCRVCHWWKLCTEQQVLTYCTNPLNLVRIVQENEKSRKSSSHLTAQQDLKSLNKALEKKKVNEAPRYLLAGHRSSLVGMGAGRVERLQCKCGSKCSNLDIRVAKDWSLLPNKQKKHTHTFFYLESNGFVSCHIL